jgi:hypothetical protein
MFPAQIKFKSSTNQGHTSTRIDDKARATAEKKDLSVTTLNTFDSFVVLDDEDIIARALEMGISHDSFPLEKINYLKDLENGRHTIKDMQGNATVDTHVEPSQILLLDFGDDIDDEFTGGQRKKDQLRGRV